MVLNSFLYLPPTGEASNRCLGPARRKKFNSFEDSGATPRQRRAFGASPPIDAARPLQRRYLASRKGSRSCVTLGQTLGDGALPIRFFGSTGFFDCNHRHART